VAGFRKISVLMLTLVIAEFDSVSESLYIVADLDSAAGLDLIKEGLNSLVCWAILASSLNLTFVLGR